MGCQLGMPSLKLSNTSKPSKHCGNFGGVSREALEEREGRDLDINHELTQNNILTGFRTAAELIEYSDNHVKELRDAQGRAIRKDAVRMCATICKPPAFYINRILQEQGEAAAEKFFDDFSKKFASIVGEENIKSTALHKDELGWHLHTFWEPMTEDGRLCAKEVHGLKFFAKINQEMPEYMRSCGWEIDDCNCYDCAEENYENEKKSAKKQEEDYQRTHSHGKSSAQFKAEAEAERQRLLNEIEKQKQKQKDLAEEFEKQRQETSEDLAQLQNMCEIENDEQYEAAKEKVSADIAAIETFCDISMKAYWRAEDDKIGYNSKNILNEFTFDISKLLEKLNGLTIFDLIDRIKKAIDDIALYEKIKKIKDGVAAVLENRLNRTIARASERSEATNSTPHKTEKEQEL